MTVSIIIAVKTWQKNLKVCIANCLKLGFSDFEILILPDSFSNNFLEEANTFFTKFRLTEQEKNIPLKIIPTGVRSLPEKISLAINYTNADILVFIDDHVHSEKNWLKREIERFQNQEVVAVVGSVLITQSENSRHKPPNADDSTFVVSRDFILRDLTKQIKEIEGYPGYKLLLRRSLIGELGNLRQKF